MVADHTKLQSMANSSYLILNLVMIILCINLKKKIIIVSNTLLLSSLLQVCSLFNIFLCFFTSYVVTLACVDYIENLPIFNLR